MQVFDSGATRDSDENKFDYEGFLNPLVIRRYAAYMHKHRLQADGQLRDSDNWQKGIPIAKYMKSLWRHFMDLWTIHRGYPAFDDKDGHLLTKQEVLCSVIFNAMGYLYEELKKAQCPPLPVESADLKKAFGSLREDEGFVESAGDVKAESEQPALVHEDMSDFLEQSAKIEEPKATTATNVSDLIKGPSLQ